MEQQRRDARGSDGHSFREPARVSGPIGADESMRKDGSAAGGGLELFDHDFNDFGTAEDLDMLFNVDDLSRSVGPTTSFYISHRTSKIMRNTCRILRNGMKKGLQILTLKNSIFRVL